MTALALAACFAAAPDSTAARAKGKARSAPTAAPEAVSPLNAGLADAPWDVDRSSPRACVDGLFAATARGDFEGAAHYLDLKAIPAADQPADGARLAKRISIVLRRNFSARLPHLSRSAVGIPERDVAADEESLGLLDVEGAKVPLRLARVPLPGGSTAWVVSAATVAATDDLYERHGAGWAGEHLPQVFVTWRLWSLELWQWLGVVLALVLALVAGFVMARVATKRLLHATHLFRQTDDERLALTLIGPVSLAATLVVLALLRPLLLFQGSAAALAGNILSALTIVVAVWLLLRAADVASLVLSRRASQRANSAALAMIPVARRIAKGVVVAVMFVVALHNAGINVTGLVAGLGIGGLAAALAAQKTVENVFGSVVIAFDRPFKIGDLVKIGDHVGYVEEVGFRSTRLRTWDRTIVTIPNGQAADARIENYDSRDRMRIHTKLGLTYAATPDQLRAVVAEVDAYLANHPRAWKPERMVRFVGYAESSQEIEVMAWIETHDWNEFLAIREQVLLSFGDIVRGHGCSFAFPTRTVVQEKV